MTAQSIPRIVIGAPKGRSGKTTVTMGLLAALTNLGLTVQPFKKGPDYIDPSWMTAIAGRPCSNLDSVMMSNQTILDSFLEQSQQADISIVEGAMGLYDGLDLQGSGSTAQIAKIIKAPVILVLDCTRMTRSAAATVLGYQHFDKEVNISGIILNKVGGARHQRILREAIETFCRVPVIGSIPKNNNLTIPDRHLGLIPANETDKFTKTVEAIGNVIAENVDLRRLLKIASNNDSLPNYSFSKEANSYLKGQQGSKRVTIAVIRDQVFSFYYPENLRQLESEGAKLVFINSLVDTSLHQVDGLYIGGGFPELFGAGLDANKELRANILRAIYQGLPVYAECGGLMYLGRKLIYKGQEFAMVGALPYDVVMEEKPQGHGYTIMKVMEPNGFFD
ncbi:MAG: cobyrinate a,c-diamide synthase, partial [Bacillota bacterium]|nr:cobyrinate a,c-diamide synthase [Bacillota bacterium]